MTTTFTKTTHKEALAKSASREPWVVEGLVSATSTLVVGESKIGKSYLLSALVAGLTELGDFLDRPVADNGVGYSVAVAWTDDDGDREYAERIETVIPDEAVPDVEYYHLGVMRSPDMWRDLFDAVVADGHNVLVIDNLAQALNGSMNEDGPIRDFYEGVRMFTHAGIPVVVLHHSSDSTGPSGYKPERPMGHHLITASVRHVLTMRYAKKGNLVLKSRGNQGHPFSLTLKPLAGARYEVVAEQNITEAYEEAEKRETERADETKSRRRELARWIVDNAQGGPAAVARAVTARCPLKSDDGAPYKENTIKQWLKTGQPLAELIERDGDGDGWRFRPVGNR